MAQATGTTDSYDLIGLAEDVEDVINNISPTETPMYTMAKRKKATATLHQWQTDTLASAGANQYVEGDDSTYAAITPTVMLSNYTQISKKTVMVSGTADAVRKYGRREEFAYQIAKKGRELKRDIEWALVSGQGSHAGGSATVRSSAGFEAMITNVSKLGTAGGTVAGYSNGIWAAATDGTTSNFATITQASFQTAAQLSWAAGGDPSVAMCGVIQKAHMASFAGATSYAGFYNSQSKAAEGAVIAGVDLIITEVGKHKVVLNRYMSAHTVFMIDPEYISVAFLRPIKFEQRAKTGDATRGELLAEYCLVVDNPDAHAQVRMAV